MPLRDTARTLFAEALAAVELRDVLRRKLVRSGGELRIAGQSFDLGRFPHIVVIAVGKAAVPMGEGLLHVLEPHAREGARLEGIVVGAPLPTDRDPRLHYCLGSHPLPDNGSLGAAARTLQLLGRCGRESLVFFLISGGSSAMLELALDPTLPLEDVVAFHRALVHSGLNIAETNALRKHISAVKGGRLAVAAGGATMCTLLVSDVPQGMPEVIGSGPSLPDTSSVADCRELLSTKLHAAAIPGSIRAWFARADCPETPKPGDATFRRASWHTLLSSDDLCGAAASAARARGFAVELDLSCDEWNYREAALHLLDRLRAMPHDRDVCLISAGELAVPIRGEPGVGGRNAQFALECARLLAQDTSSTAVLSAGSDGLDGNSPAAGGVVDGTTAARASAHGLSLGRALAAFDAFPLLHTLGDAIVTGPSANNLRDLRLLLRPAASTKRETFFQPSAAL